MAPKNPTSHMPKTMAQRSLALFEMQQTLQTTLAQTKAYYHEQLKRVTHLAEVAGFDVTLTPLMTAEVAIEMTWSCEKRREGIDQSETKEIELMISNVEAVGFRKIEVHHETHKVSVAFRVG